MIYRLVYASFASKEITEKDLKDIAKISNLRNKEDGITGMLFWYDSNIMQILEGKANTVLDLYARIRKDPRNSDCYVLHSGHFNMREFPNWSMGFQPIPSQDITEFAFQLSCHSYANIISNAKDTILTGLTRTFGHSAGIDLFNPPSLQR